MPYEYHPIADLFPDMTEEEFNSLRRDIRANGLKQLIVKYKGQILDGKHRLRACLAEDIEPKFREYVGEDPLAEAKSLNLERRHLSPSQLAMIGARLLEYQRLIDAPKNRQLCRSEDKTDKSTQESIAAELGVSVRQIGKAQDVLEEAEPEIVAAVEAGTMTVNAADKAKSLPKKTQKRIAADSKTKGKRKTGSAVVEAKLPPSTNDQYRKDDTELRKNAEKALRSLVRCLDDMDIKTHLTALQAIKDDIKKWRGK